MTEKIVTRGFQTHYRVGTGQLDMKEVDANKSTGVSSHSKGVSGPQPRQPIGRCANRLRRFDGDAGGDAARFDDCEEKEDPDWIQHPEAGFSDAIDHCSQNISYH